MTLKNSDPLEHGSWGTSRNGPLLSFPPFWDSLCGSVNEKRPALIWACEYLVPWRWHCWGEFRMCGFAGGSMSPSGKLLELTGSPLFPLTPSVLMVNSVVSHRPIPASLPSFVAVLPCHNGLLTHWNYKQNKLLQWFASGYSVLSQQWKINSMYPIFWSGSGPSTRGSMTGHCPCWCPAWSSVNEHYSWSWNQYFPNCGRHHRQGSWQQFSWLPAFLKSGWTETAEPSS